MWTGFRDRREAGRALAAALSHYARRPDVIVLALPRGGVPVAYELAERLEVPFDVFLVRKLGAPGHEELALGAIASGGTLVLNRDVIRSLGIDQSTIQRVVAEESAELERRERAYRGDRRSPDLRGKTVILVDDGLATGSTMLAAVAAVSQHDPARIVVAVPVAAPEVCEAVRPRVDEVVCLATPRGFTAVGLLYEDFRPVSDEEVRRLLAAGRRAPAASVVGR